MKVLLLTLAILSLTSAMIWTTSSKPTASESDWPGVLPMDPSGEMEKSSCVATMITKRHAITAAHCFEQAQWSSFKVSVDGTTATVDKVYLNKCFVHADDGPNGGDLAIIRFTADVTSTYYPIYTAGDEIGKTFNMMGWGRQASYADAQNKVYTEGVFLVGANKFTSTNAGTIGYSFDNPIYDDSGAVAKESLAFSGDSGSPAMITSGGTVYIAGVNSGGGCCAFGSKDEYKRLADNLVWIQSIVTGDGQTVSGTTSVTQAAAYQSDSCAAGGSDGDSAGIWNVSLNLLFIFTLALIFKN